MKIVVGLAALVAVVYCGFCALLYFMQGRLLYPGAADSNPQKFDSMRIQSGTAVLKVWVLHPEAGPALLYFGGNGEDLGADLPDFDTAFPGRAVYFMNYRSYGGSTGVPSEAALIADAQVTYDRIAKTHSSVALMGRSLGTGVAVALATTRPVEKVILVTPYDSIASIAADRYRWAPVRWLIKDHYDSVKRMPHVRAPVLVIIAEHDASIPLFHSDALLASIPAAQRHSVMIRGATHSDFGDYDRYLAIVRDFLRE